MNLHYIIFFKVYHVGSTDSWSNLYRFKTLPDATVGNGWTLKFLIFGDLGNGEAKTLSLLQDEIEFQRRTFRRQMEFS